MVSEVCSEFLSFFCKIHDLCSVFLISPVLGMVVKWEGGVWGEFVRLGEHRDFPLSIFKHTIIAAMIVVV